ncbi:MAG TPA: vWA domain-containing protein [Gaiellaceae bacterium]
MATLAERARRRVRGPAIPLASTARLAGAARRTLIVRVALAVVLVGLLVLASTTGRGNAAATHGLLPGGGSGMLVLDVSRSIKPEADQTIVNVLERLIRSQTRIGLIAFSDIAYEMLPPGSPARELRPLVRLFAPPARPRPGLDPTTPTPWTSNFSGGTQISSGLVAAHDALVRAGNRHGPILLVSDLDTAPDDVPRVAQTLNTFRNLNVPFRIVALTPRADNLALFKNLAGKGAFDAPVTRVGHGVGAAEGALQGSVPWTLILIAGLALVALAANEHWCGRLPVPRTQP